MRLRFEYSSPLEAVQVIDIPFYNPADIVKARTLVVDIVSSDSCFWVPSVPICSGECSVKGDCTRDSAGIGF